jgi:hypothetical protein
VILRIWSAALVPARLEEYRRFEAERSLPMLHRKPGFLGVFFLRAAEDRAASITIWEDRGAVEASESSPSYRRTAPAPAPPHEVASFLVQSAMLGGRDLAGRALNQRGQLFAGESTDLYAPTLGLRMELRPVGEASGCRVKEPKQVMRRTVVNVDSSQGGLTPP